MSTQKTVGSVKRSLDIIEAVTELKGARISELSDYLDMTESSIHSHLTTLKNEGYVVKRGNNYDIGMRYIQLGRYAKHQNPICRKAKQKLREIASETGEVASIMVEQNGFGYYVFGRKNYNTNQPCTEGRITKLHYCAPGKAILAHYPPERVEKIISEHGLVSRTNRTITEEGKLFEELAKIRECGVAFNRGECIEGLRGVGVPIIGEAGEVVAAIGVYGPSHRVTGEFLETELPDLLEAHANDIHLDLVYGGE
ncbi:IclR family transcriptional regulator [Haladaptatus sp. CMAA 1911]|uniref:IclR family transcriptional regulator n=1 Tax=unclassified Haladaptatus TaxID=2622732 RepID=UPI003754C890